jgi:hypothetical protein
MPFLPRRVTGPRAWWLDVVVSLLAVGTAQAIVFGGDTLLDRIGRGSGGPGFEAAVVLERAPGGSNGSGSAEIAPVSVLLDGAVTGLYPGAEADLQLQVRNGSSVAVQLERLTITVGTPDREGCPADAILVGSPASPGEGSTGLDVRLAPEGTATLRVPVAMVAGAPSACQGATFPLLYLTEGTLP